MNLKKAISGILATAVLASAMLTSVQPALAWDAPTTIWQPAATENVTARFFIGSDVHIGRNNDATKKLENALNVFNTVDSKADAVLLVGDVTNNGDKSEYDTLMNTINASALGKAGKVKLSMGNHEYNNGNMARFEEKTKQKANEVLYFDNEGNATSAPGNTLAATVIKLSAKNYDGDYTDQYEMVETALKTANNKNSKAPIIVMGHHGIKDTAYVTNEWNGNYGAGTDKDMVALFKQYPQVIHFSGHSHATLEDARSIYQNDGYTAIQDGTIGAYFENESGKVDPTSGAAATRPADSEIASQALRLDVMNDGTVKIYRMNLTTGEYMYESKPWTFKPGDATDRPYDENRTSQAPSFDEDATVTSGTTSEKSVTVQFPAATAASDENNDMIHEYHITLTPKDGGSSITRSVFADYYEATPKADWQVNITGLKAGTTYEVAVTAVTSFGAESGAITGEVSTNAKKPYVTPEPDVLNIDFSSNNTSDANGHEMTTVGEPTQVQDDTYGTVYRFDGKDDGFRYTMTDSDYDKFKDGYTMEVLVKSNGKTNDEQDFFSNQQGAGCGFALHKDGKTLEFWNNTTSDLVKPDTDVSSLDGQWMHLMATFDGETTKLYVNGELKDKIEKSGSLSVPGVHYFYLGGDSNSNGDLEFPANCDIALARLYSGAMNATDVAKTYETVVPNDSYETPKPDVLNIDFSSNNTNDANDHELTTVGEPTQVQDDTYGTVYRFDGKDDGFRYAMTDSDYAKFKDGYTMEVLVNLHDLNAAKDPFANMESAGCGFELNGDGQHIAFWNHVDGYKKPTADISDYENEWVHLVATFDGNTTKLYVNGELQDTVDSKGSMTVPKENAHYFFLGGDTSGSGTLQNPANCDIALARLYSGAMSATDVGKAYAAVHKTPSPTFTATLDYNKDGGTASVDPTSAKAGETVTITTTPNEGYQTDSVVVTDANGSNVSLTNNGDGTFSFTQPAANVTVSVIFNKHYTPDINETTGGTVRLDPASPKAGDEVTIAPQAEPGYKVDHVTLTVLGDAVQAASNNTAELQPGDTITLTADADGTYHFTQPAYKVKIDVTFTKENTGNGGHGGSSVTHYTPDVTHTNGGTVSVAPSAPKAGDEVTITPKAEEGYEVESITVTDKNGHAISTTQNDDGTVSFEQPHESVNIHVIFTEKETTWDNPYSDVHENDWFYDPVRYVQQNGLIVGISDDQFAPNLTTSRAMLVTILWRQAGAPVVHDAATFSDVAADSWYADAVSWASSEGVVGGYGNGLFGPNDPITREQLASMLCRFSQYSGADTSTRGDVTSFNDAASISAWAQEPVQWAVGEGLLGGFEDNTLRPQGQATRAQVAALLQRFCEA